MEKKLKIADFAALIGVSQKTAYKMRDRNEIMTVNEKVNNRTIELVVITDDKLEELKNIYRKNVVNDGNYYEIVTDNDLQQPVNDGLNSDPPRVLDVDLLEKYINLSERYLNDVKLVNDELVNVKSRTLLLEDKAGREGSYLKEINELKTNLEEVKNSKEELKFGNESLRKDIEILKADNDKLKKEKKYLFLGAIVIVILLLILAVAILVMCYYSGLNMQQA